MYFNNPLRVVLERFKLIESLLYQISSSLIERLKERLIERLIERESLV